MTKRTEITTAKEKRNVGNQKQKQMIKVIHYLKSKNEKDLFEWCNPIEIDKKKLKVNYRYDICKFLKDTEL